MSDISCDYRYVRVLETGDVVVTVRTDVAGVGGGNENNDEHDKH